MREIRISDYFKNDNVSHSARDWRDINRIRDEINSFDDEKDIMEYLYERRQSSYNRQEDKRLFGIDINDEIGTDWIHKTNKYHNQNSRKNESDVEIPKLDYKKRDFKGKQKYNKDGTEAEYGKFGRGMVNFANNAMRTKFGKGIFFIIKHIKLILLGLLVSFIVTALLTLVIYICGTLNSLGHTPFVLCGDDEITGDMSVQLPSAKVEEMSSPDYAAKAFISVAKSRGWKNNAIIGALAYTLQEGIGMGTFTYENYYVVNGPSNTLTDRTLDNQKWLDWLQSPSTLARYNEVYYGANTSRYAAIGLGLWQMTDTHNTPNTTESSGATNMVKAAMEAGKPWQDPLWQCEYLIDKILPGYSGDSDYADPTTFDGSAEEYCRRITATVGMPGWSMNTNNSYMLDHTRHVPEATKMLSDFTGIDIGSLTEQTKNPCQGADSVISIGNKSIAESAVSLASGLADKGDKILFDMHGPNSPNLNDQRLKLYKEKHMEFFPNDKYFASCDAGSATAIVWSGADVEFPPHATGDQYTYLKNSPKWNYVGDYGKTELKPGDVLITKGDGHIKIYVGNEAVQKRFPGSNADMYAASLEQYFPVLYKDDPSYDSRVYAVFRNVKPDKEQ